MTTLDTVMFETDSFTWHDGAFVLTGRWSDDAAGLGRVRLLVDVDGRQRNIGAQGGKTAGGDAWRATFICSREPGPGALATLKVGGVEIALPSPVLAPAPAEQKEAASLLEQLRAEREALDRARQALASERKAAEELEARLSALRRRGAVAEPEQPAEYAWLGIAVAGAIAFLFLLVLIWVL